MACACSIGAIHVGRARRAGHGPGRVRRARRAGLPAHRRPAGHLGRPGGDRQAGPLGPAGQEEVAARGGRADQRHRRPRTSSARCWPARTRSARTTCCVPPRWSRRPAAGPGRRPRRTASSPPRASAWPTPTCPLTSAPSSPGSPSSSPRGSAERPGDARDVTASHAPASRPCREVASGNTGPGGRAPARPAARGRLVAGRAGDQRHHGRRGPAAAGVPADPDAGADRRGGPLDQVPAARRRHLGQLRGRPG